MSGDECDEHALGEPLELDSDEEPVNAVDAEDAKFSVGAVDRVFARTGLWEGKELMHYDDIKAGPANLPKGFMDFTPLQIIMLLMPLYLWELVQVQTNLYHLENHKGAFETPCDLRHIFVFVGLMMKMVGKWSRAQDSYFDGTGAFDATVYMSRRRFYWIKRWLHFVDNKKKPKPPPPDWDPLFSIRPVLTILRTTFARYWKMSEIMALDEQMVMFKGRNPFHRFIPRKPHPNGTKVHTLCDSAMYYCVALVVDTTVSRSIPDVVNELFECAGVMAGQTIITDRFYTCTPLVALCCKRGVGFIGSTMKNRFLAKRTLSGWTKAEAKLLPRGTYEVATNRERTIANIIWKDKGIVRLTATAGSSIRVRLTRGERGRSKFKVHAPHAAEIFDDNFHGCDRDGQLKARPYSLCLSFRAMKWPTKLFLGLVDMAMVNAWILWRELHPRDHKKHAWFYDTVANELLLFNPKGNCNCNCLIKET